MTKKELIENYKFNLRIAKRINPKLSKQGKQNSNVLIACYKNFIDDLSKLTN